jgi:hypothetical protein
MKRTKCQKHQPLRIGIFSPAEIRLAQDAVKAFEDWLHQAGHQEPKKAYAEETVILVKSKLERLRAAPNHPELFAYNEHLVLFAAIQDYMETLRADPPTPRRAERLRQCAHIKRFASQAFEAIRPQATQD